VGYIVEQVSGRPFNDYVNENIFKPLAWRILLRAALPVNEALMSMLQTSSGKPKPSRLLRKPRRRAGDRI